MLRLILKGAMGSCSVVPHFISRLRSHNGATLSERRSRTTGRPAQHIVSVRGRAGRLHDAAAHSRASGVTFRLEIGRLPNLADLIGVVSATTFVRPSGARIGVRVFQDQFIAEIGVSQAPVGRTLPEDTRFPSFGRARYSVHMQIVIQSARLENLFRFLECLLTQDR